jgi:hypothetical protein
MELVQIFSLLGALMQLVVYGSMQTKRIEVESHLYQGFNTIGSLIMATVSIVIGSYGFLLLEGSWMLISAFGWYKYYKK